MAAITGTMAIGLAKFGITELTGHFKGKRDSREFGAFSAILLGRTVGRLQDILDDVNKAVSGEKPVDATALAVHQARLGDALENLEMLVSMMGLEKDTDGDGVPDGIDRNPTNKNKQ